jgi:hypothetical protein
MIGNSNSGSISGLQCSQHYYLRMQSHQKQRTITRALAKKLPPKSIFKKKLFAPKSTFKKKLFATKSTFKKKLFATKSTFKKKLFAPNARATHQLLHHES